MSISAVSIPAHWKATLQETAFSQDAKLPLPLKHGKETVLNLDKVASSYIKNLYGDKVLASCDALFCKNGKYYFIEFKNQDEKNVSSNDVRAKTFSSILIANLLLCPQCSISDLSSNSELFVVFKDSDEPNYINKLAYKLNLLSNLSGEPLFFKLRPYIDNGMYKDIHTIPVSVFNNQYSDSIFE